MMEERPMAEKTVATSTTQKGEVTRESTRNQERYVSPPVDIYETPQGLIVMADLPGVTKDTLDVRVDNNILTIRGLAHHRGVGDAVQREYELMNFFRQFELGEKIDQGKISADLKHGVLTLDLPKAEEAKPRRVEVKVG
jgi:HSP20 family molecular chaperone IbpA